MRKIRLNLYYLRLSGDKDPEDFSVALFAHKLIMENYNFGIKLT